MKNPFRHWPPPIVLCVVTLSLSTFASSLSSEGTVILFLLLENAGWSQRVAFWTLAIFSALSVLVALSLARRFDGVGEFTSSPWVVVVTSGVMAALRIGLAAACTFLPMDQWRGNLGTGIMIMTLLLLQTLDLAILAPWLTLTLDRAVTRRQGLVHTRAWGLVYGLSNVSIALAMIFYDTMRTHPGLALTPPMANAVTQWVGATLGCLVFGTSLLFFTAPCTAVPTYPPPPPSSSRTEESWFTMIHGVRFWRFVAFLLVMQGALSLFFHLGQTLPLTLQRLYQGSKEVHFALLQGLNPTAIFILAPLFQWLTERQPSYWVIVGGSLLSSLSVVIVAAAASASYVPHVLFILTFSLGEALWSPRLMPYILSLASPQEKILYQACARVPPLLTRFLIVAHSTALLHDYCPSADPGACHPRTLWAIVFAMSFITPMALSMFSRWIRPDRPPPPLLMAMGPTHPEPPDS